MTIPTEVAAVLADARITAGAWRDIEKGEPDGELSPQYCKAHGDCAHELEVLIGRLKSALTAKAEAVATISVHGHVGGDDGSNEYHFSGKVPPGKYDIVKHVKHAPAVPVASVPDGGPASVVPISALKDLAEAFRENAGEIPERETVAYQDCAEKLERLIATNQEGTAP